MFKFLKWIFGSGNRRSASNFIAKNRLTVVLVQDRTGLTSRELEEFRASLISVIEKYFVIDVSGFDLDYKRQGDCTILSISSPVLIKRLNSNQSESLELEIENAGEIESISESKEQKDSFGNR